MQTIPCFIFSESLTLKDMAHAANAPIVYVCNREDEADLLQRQLTSLGVSAVYFPGWDCLPYDVVSPSPEVRGQRVSVLLTLIESPQKPSVILTTVDAFLQRLPPPDSLRNRQIRIAVGDSLSRENLLLPLIKNGYYRTEIVREQGEFAVRGSLIDLFPLSEAAPIRIDFFGDEVEALRYFDPMTQRGTGACASVSLGPVSELTVVDPLPATLQSFTANRQGIEHWSPLFFEKMSHLSDYLPAETRWVFNRHALGVCADRLAMLTYYYKERTSTLSPLGVAFLPPEQLYLTAVEVQTHSERAWHISDHPAPQAVSFDFSPTDLMPRFEAYRQTLSQKVIVACLTEGSRDRLCHILQEQGVAVPTISFSAEDAFSSAAPPYVAAVFPTEKSFATDEVVVISEQDLLGERISRPSRRGSAVETMLLEFSQLTVGDLVVHRDHGIGRYEGLEVVTVDRVTHDCFRLTYHNNDQLLVPVENMDVLTRYGGASDTVSLDRLGAAQWQQRKAAARQKIFDMANHLVTLAAKRALDVGEVITYPTAQLEAFCARFPYPETDDQLRAIEDTLADLESGQPMDRLICGDVGFGKTEVALRAAFAVAASGRQVILVTPTTLLCRQHMETFTKRFEGFPILVAQLSRFISAKEATAVRAGVASGEVGILIATHAAFSDKMSFADLGLVIVDEEQHFGVKQKEKMKELKANVHILTLTATPIPRTLQLALTGVRQMSLIATPPMDRLAVRTVLMPYDRVTIRDAILREYHRGGQVYYVIPRLNELDDVEKELRLLVPEVTIGVAHGQLSAAELDRVTTDFYAGKYHLLLATNIIECGIDVPAANTLIVHRSDLFGLAQLYQLRGRVGRSKTQGYAYFTLDPKKPLTEQSKKRLDIMTTLDKLGAGFTLATHDMDVRGTGNLIGSAQSGHVKEVGVELYQNLLQEAIAELREYKDEAAVQVKETWTPQINLGLSVMIPADYVRDLGVRLSLYRRISNLKKAEDVIDFTAELRDRFGVLPPEVNHLMTTVNLKLFCLKYGIEKLDAGERGLIVTFKTSPDLDRLLPYIMNPKTDAKLRPDSKISFSREWETHASRLTGVQYICHELAGVLGDSER